MIREKFSPSINEYNLLRQEINNRISIVNSQAHTAILTILTIWGTGFLLFTNAINVMKDDRQSPLLFIALISVIFLVPVFYFIPLSVKSGENIIQITSIAAYIKIFYEFKTIKKRNYTFCWETVHTPSSTFFSEKGKARNYFLMFNAEYTILSCCSILIFIIICLIFFNLCYFEMSVLEKTFFKIFFVSSLILGICGCFLIHKNSSINKIYKYKVKDYIKKHLETALKIKFYSYSEYKEAWSFFELTEKD